MINHALVTGGSSGIGSSAVQALAKKAKKITFTYNKNHKTADIIKKKIRRLGCEPNAIKVKFEDTKSLQNLVLYLEKNPVDLLVNNAAMASKTSFTNISKEELDLLWQVNLKAPFLISQVAFEAMLKKGKGHIINIGSIGGQIGGVQQAHYAVMKGGLETLTKSLARLGAEHGIYCFTISPGVVETDMLLKMNPDVGSLEINIPQRRLGKKDNIGDLICDLCAEHWSYASGITINFNGGLLLKS